MPAEISGRSAERGVEQCGFGRPSYSVKVISSHVNAGCRSGSALRVGIGHCLTPLCVNPADELTNTAQHDADLLLIVLKIFAVGRLIPQVQPGSNVLLIELTVH